MTLTETERDQARALLTADCQIENANRDAASARHAATAEAITVTRKDYAGLTLIEIAIDRPSKYRDTFRDQVITLTRTEGPDGRPVVDLAWAALGDVPLAAGELMAAALLEALRIGRQLEAEAAHNG